MTGAAGGPPPGDVDARAGAPPARPGASPVVVLRGVGVVEQGAPLLHAVDLEVGRDAHTVVLGPNGSGKTTLLRVVAGYRFPTTGTVAVLGERFGHTDLRRLRRRVGLVSAALGDLLQVAAPVEDLVAAARYGATVPVAEARADPAARRAARAALEQVGAAHLARRRCRTLSQGEWQRVQIARSLVVDPALLLLDEPMAALDVAGRERLLADLDRLMRQPDGPTVVLVTHHLEEIPPAVVSAVLLAAGRVVAAGRIEDVLEPEGLRSAFGVELAVERSGGRYHARLA